MFRSFLVFLFHPTSLSLSLSLLACLRFTKMRSCPPTTPSRRTACVDLVASPLRLPLLLSLSLSPSPSLSSCRRWERKEKRRSRCKVPWPPRGGCTPDARWLRVLSWLLDRYSCKINLVSSPMIVYPPLAFLSLLSSSRTRHFRHHLRRSSSCIGASQKIDRAQPERHIRMLFRVLFSTAMMISR